MNVNNIIQRLILGVLFVLIGISTYAQQTIAFQNINFAEAKAKAKQENKLIFLDGYTSWCAPCKWMERNVFNTTEVANYYNANFINIKVDCEVGEGIDLAKHYKINSFPTYLFLNADGELMYRTQSRMEADAFLKEGQQAMKKEFQIPTIKAAFDQGNRDPEFLLRYIAVMSKVDGALAQPARAALDEMAKSDAFMKSPVGWKAITQLTQNGNDWYGSYFLKNKPYFEQTVPQEEYVQMEQKLLRYAMYDYIRNNNNAEFDKGLLYFKNSKDVEKQEEAAMYEVEWAGVHGTDAEFIKLTNNLRKGLLKENDDRLSFIARRFAGKYARGTEPSAKLIEQCYVLAKQAVTLNPDSYSNQGTLADICITQKKKAEAIKAAEAARALAEFETSKIIKLADKLVERAKSI